MFRRASTQVGFNLLQSCSQFVNIPRRTARPDVLTALLFPRLAQFSHLRAQHVHWRGDSWVNAHYREAGLVLLHLRKEGHRKWAERLKTSLLENTFPCYGTCIKQEGWQIKGKLAAWLWCGSIYFTGTAILSSSPMEALSWWVWSLPVQPHPPHTSNFGSIKKVM